MIRRGLGIAGLSLGLFAGPSVSWAADLHVIDSSPKASEVLDGRSTAFFVRFDRPVDHLHSLLTITDDADSKVVQTLHPRAGTAQDLLFSRASTLPPGDYKLHWSVRSMVGAEVAQGDIPFKVGNAQ